MIKKIQISETQFELPEIIYADEEKILIRREYLIVYNLQDKSISMILDLSTCGLDDYMTEDNVRVEKVTDDGQIVYMSKLNEDTNERIYYECKPDIGSIILTNLNEVKQSKEGNLEKYVDGTLDSESYPYYCMTNNRLVRLEPYSSNEYSSYKDLCLAVYDKKYKQLYKLPLIS